MSESNGHLVHMKNLLKRLETVKNSGIRRRSFDVLCHKDMDSFTDSMVELATGSLTKHKIYWEKFDDGTDMIDIDALAVSKNYFEGKDLIFVACFHSNDATLSQLHLITYLCELQPASLIVLLPFFSTGTMERIAYGEETRVPTTNTLAMFFNGMPSFGRPLQFMTYDIHALQEQFYFSNHSISRLYTAIPLVIEELKNTKINCIAFPDDGANKRFGGMFKRDENGTQVLGNGGCEYDIVTFKKTKTRVLRSDGNFEVKKVTDLLEGMPEGKNVIIVDDQTKSGRTLFECASKLKELNASQISIYVTHAVFTDDFWEKFKKVSHEVEHFYVTNSMPTKCSKIDEFPELRDKFKVIPLAPRVLKDLFGY